MAEMSMELKEKIHKVLGIPPNDITALDPVDLLDELCETVIMLDEGTVVAQLTALRSQLYAINGRIWNLMGHKDPRKARSDLAGIGELEKYVGEIKRRSGEPKEVPAKKKPAVEEVPVARQDENLDRIKELEVRVSDVQHDLQNLFDTLMEVEALEEQARDFSAQSKPAASPGKGAES